MVNKDTDIIIVGAGPIGLSVAISAAQKKMDYLVLEKGVLVNSVYHFPASMTFFSTAPEIELGGLPFICQGQKPIRAEALQYYRRVAQYFDLNIRYQSRVEKIEKRNGTFDVELSSKEILKAKYVVLATGYYDNPNLLNIPGEELPKVSHYYTESHYYYGKKVAIVGGRNSAAEAALEIYRSGGKVTLIHRKSDFDEKMKYWVRPDITNRIKNGEILGCFNSHVIRITEKSIFIRVYGKDLKIKNDNVLLLTGYHPDSSFMRQAGIEIDEKTLVPQQNPDTFETNVKGLYISGALTVGKEANKIFIENGRLHGDVIISDIEKKLK